MPRQTNPGDISTGPGKAVSTDADQLVLKDMGAALIGEGAFIPPGDMSPRAGYPALPCRACGGVGGGASPSPTSSVEETILTVGLPNANGAWTGFVPNYLTLADAVTAAGLLMNDDAGAPGRAVRILVVGPTVESLVPIQIPASGLIIEGYSGLEGIDAAITWQANVPLFDLGSRDNLIFRDLRFKWNGIAAPPSPPTRTLFSTSSSSPITQLIIDNCHCAGPIQGFVGPENFSGSMGGFELCSFTRNSARDLLEWGILSFTFTNPPFQGCVIRENVFEQLVYGASVTPAIGSFAGGPPSNSTTIEANLLSGFSQGISTVVLPSETGTMRIVGNIIGNTEYEGIYIEGPANQVVGNSLFRVHTSGVTPRGIFVSGDSNFVESNFVFLDGNGLAIEIDSAGEHNVCTHNDVSSDSDGEIYVYGALSIITGNKAKSIRSYGNYSTVDHNLVDAGAQVRILGIDSTVEANIIATDLRIEADGCTVVGNRVADALTLAGTADRCTVGSNRVGGNLTVNLDSFRHTISGNAIDGNLTVFTSGHAITGNSVQGLTGLTLQAAAHNCTVGDNSVLNDIIIHSQNNTVVGNRADNNITVNGNWNGVTGNKAYNNITISGASCTVESNKGDLLQINGPQTTVGHNRVEDIAVNTSSCTISGNWVLAQILTTGAAQHCTLGDNTTENMVVNGPDSTIGNNVVGVDIQVGGANSTISGNRVSGGGSADILAAAAGCTLNGNIVAGAVDVQGWNSTIGNNTIGDILSVSGVGCAITGNRVVATLGPGDIVLGSLGCTVVGNNIDGNIIGAAAGNMAVGNIARGGWVLGVATPIPPGNTPGNDNNI